MWLNSMIRNGWTFALVFGAGILLQGCLESEDVYDPSDYFERDVETIKDYIISNSIDAQLDTAAGIFYQEHLEGMGYKAVRGTAVDIHYRGETLDGTQFVNTFSGLPERIYIGAVQSYPAANPENYVWGLDEWLVSHHQEGDSVTVYLPSAYAFENKSYGAVGPNTPVVYTVKFVDIKLLSEELEDIDQYITDQSWTSLIEPTYGTRYVVHEAGDPDKNIEMGDQISINYKGSLLDGTEFDSNYGDSPWIFTLGEISVIPGFELGLMQLNNSDSATFFVPSIYGYGKNGSGEVIPGNAILRFDVSVREVTKY